MEGNGTDTLSDGLAFESNGFDTNDEVMLLRMMETNNEPVSPRLQAVLDSQPDLGWTPRPRQQSPLFMERPQSPGVDAAAFSFAKPAQNGKPFSLQPAPRRPSSGVNLDQVRDTNDAEKLDKAHTGQATTTVASPAGSAETSASPNQTSQLHTTPNTEIRPTSRCSVDHAIREAPKQDSQCDRQQLFPTNNSPDMESGSPLQSNHEQTPQQTDNSGLGLERLPSFERPNSEHNGLSEPRPDSRQWKVVKRRRSDNRKVGKRVSYLPSDTSVEVSEEALFHQLINRMKDREKSEAMASKLQREMETNMTALRGENDALREELRILSVKLQKRSTEARAYRAQNESWKSKLNKIKVFFNELGADYQNLRGDAIHFKAARKTLDKERKEIVESIEDIKGRLSTVSQASLEQCRKLSDAGSLITSLNQDLKHTREKVQYSQSQLADEKKRSRLLETYIQSSSRAQDKKLDLMRSSQLDIMTRLETAFEAASRNYESTHVVVNEVFERKLEDILALVRGTTERFSNDTMDLQQCKEAIQKLQSCLGATTRELGENVGKHSNVAEAVIQSMEEQLRAFKDSVGEGSTLLQQLSANEDHCLNLREKLEETAPAFDNLKSSVDGLQRGEIDLRQQMKNLETRLIEVKLPERFEDDYFHISQKIKLDNDIQQLSLKVAEAEEKSRTQQLENKEKQDELREMSTRAHQAEVKMAYLESQIASLQAEIDTGNSERRRLDGELEALISALKAKEERLESEQLVGRQKQDKIRELTARVHQAENNAAGIESHAADLEEKMTVLEKEAQVNLERAISDARDRCRAEFERRLHEVAMEKAAIEMDAERAREQISELQRKLIDAEEAAGKERNGLEALLMERQKRIEDVEASRADQVSNMTIRVQQLEAARDEQTSIIAKREAEIEDLRKHEVSLRGQIDETSRKLHNFESEFMETSTDEQRSRKALQDSLSTLQGRFEKKEEDCQALQESLLSIQDQLVEKEEDCRRCQASLDTMHKQLSKSEAEKQALQGNLVNVQSELAGSKEDCEAFRLEIQTIQTELTANTKERQHLRDALSSLKDNCLDNDAALQALEDSLSSVQSILARKEEEHLVVKEQLQEVENVRRSLESGKLKAKTEIHALLKRVQDSASSIRLVRELLQRMDVAKLEQPLPEALDYLERILQAGNESRTGLVRVNQHEVQLPVPPLQHSQVEDAEGPTEMTSDGPKTPVNQVGNPQPSKQAGSIVPFSSILEGLSPDHFSMGDGDPFDLSGVVTWTPDAPAPEPSTPATPKNKLKRDISGNGQGLDKSLKLEHIPNTQQSSTEAQANPKETNAARKVSFVSQELTAERNGLQVPDSQEKSNQALDHPPRANRWTYSKRQRETSKQEATSAIATTQTEESERKKAKTLSTASTGQERTASDLYDRRKSPTRLASGSSRALSNVPNPDQVGSSRGMRRSTRRTRGWSSIRT